jgi:hypothetical protein
MYFYIKQTFLSRKNAAQGKYSNVMESLRQSMTDMVSVVHEEVYSIVHPSIRIN